MFVEQETMPESLSMTDETSSSISSAEEATACT